MLCWFCREDRAGSEEHIVPQSIGGSLTTWRVCKDCNSTLGRVADAPIGNHLLVAMRRSELSLPGYGGKIPDPLKAMLRNAVLKSDPTRKVLLGYDTDGRLSPRLVARQRETSLDDGIHLALDIDAREAHRIPEILNRKRKQLGLPPISAREAEALVTASRASARPLECSEILGSFTLETDPTRPGLIKIAYEVACLWLGDGYLNDPQAQRLSEAALGSRSLEGWKWGDSTMSVPRKFRRISGTLDQHTILLSRAGNELRALVVLFDVLTAKILISTNADAYTPPQWSGKFLQMDVSSGQRRETSLALEEWLIENSRIQEFLRTSTALHAVLNVV